MNSRRAAELRRLARAAIPGEDDRSRWLRGHLYAAVKARWASLSHRERGAFCIEEMLSAQPQPKRKRRKEIGQRRFRMEVVKRAADN